MKKLKTSLFAFSAVLLLSLLLLMNVSAAEIVTEGGIPCTCKGTAGEHNKISWTFYDDGKLEISQSQTATGCINTYYQFDVVSANWKTFRDTYNDQVLDIEVQKINKIQYNGNANYGLFDEMTNLRTVRFANSQYIVRNWGKGLFEGCTSLKSVVFGDAAFEDGVADLSGMSPSSKGITGQLFKNGTSIEKVILPACVTVIGDNAATVEKTKYQTFSGASALREVVFLGDITAIGANSFENCTSLQFLTFTENAFSSIDASAFNSTHSWDLYLTFDSGDVLTAPDGFPGTASCSYSGRTTIMGLSTEPEIYLGNAELPSGFSRTVKFLGYQVRLESYNGLRSIYVRDNDTVNSGYTLKEYGAILTAGSRKDSLGISYNGGELSFDEKVHHIAIEKDGERTDAKVLANSTVKDPSVENGTYFAYSLVDYSKTEHMKSEVYSSGYEIWVNDITGYVIIILTDLNTVKDSDKSTVSYYEVGLGLYKKGEINSSVDKNNIVWNDICSAGAVVLNAGTDYLNVLDETKDPLTTAVPTDLDGNLFGDTFTLKEVPIAARDIIKDKVLDLTVKSGITYTVLLDGSSYVLVYRPEEGKSNLSLPMINGYGKQPLSHQFMGNTSTSKWYGKFYQTTMSETDNYSTVSSARPQPLFLGTGPIAKIKTVVVDKGITGTGARAFYGLYATDYTVSTDFKNINDTDCFKNINALNKFMTATYPASAGTVDFSHLDNVGDLEFSSKTNFTTLKLPSVSYVPETLTGKTNILCAVDGDKVTEIYVPTDYNGTALDTIKEDSSYRFFFKDSHNWVERVWNGAWYNADATEATARMYNEHLFGTNVNTGIVMDNGENWEVKAFGTEGITDTEITVSVGEADVSVTLPEALRCEKLASMGSGKAGAVTRYTKREDFTYCPITNVAYVADYVSIKSVDGEVSAALYKFDASSAYDADAKTYSKITYTETPLTLTQVPESNIIASTVNVSNASELYMEVVYTAGRADTEPVEFEITKALTDDNSGLSCIARNFTVSEDGKTAYACANSAWMSYNGVSGYGAWLVEITDYDTSSPKVGRKVFLNDFGKCYDEIAAGRLPENSHTSDCPGRDIFSGRACTGAVVNGDYIYAVERYTGAFSFDDRKNYDGATDVDDGVHGHRMTTLCVINKETFEIEQRIFLQNNACSVEIYNGALFVFEMTRNWSVYDISDPANPTPIHKFSRNGEFGGDDAEKVAAYALGDTYIEYQRATFWTDGNGNHYFAASAFSGGATIWNITDVMNRIPTREAHFDIKAFNGGVAGRHVFDVAASYPYLYITVGGVSNYRFSAGNLPDGVIAIDVSEPSKVGTDKSLATVVGIPFEDEADRVDEGDPAPSRIVVKDDILITNYSDKGIALFRIGEDGIPVYDRCEVLGAGDPQTMKVNPSNGNIVIINGEGHSRTPGMFEIEIKK